MDEIDIVRIIFTLLFIIIFILLFLTLINNLNSKNIGYKEVKCYDKFGNEILGTKCKQELYCGFIDNIFVEDCKNNSEVASYVK